MISDVAYSQNRRTAMIRFQRGTYFQKRSRGRSSLAAVSSPLTDALVSLGFETRDAERIASRYSHVLLREWIDITIAARERFGTQHFKRSPQAFLMHHLSKANAGEYSPPDWWQELQKQEHRRNVTTSPELRKILRAADETQHGNDRTQSPVHIGELLKTIG